MAHYNHKKTNDQLAEQSNLYYDSQTQMFLVLVSKVCVTCVAFISVGSIFHTNRGPRNCVVGKNVASIKKQCNDFKGTSTAAKRTLNIYCRQTTHPNVTSQQTKVVLKSFHIGNQCSACRAYEAQWQNDQQGLHCNSLRRDSISIDMSWAVAHGPSCW